VSPSRKRTSSANFLSNGHDAWYSAGIFAIGEVFAGNYGYIAGYQQPKGPLSGVLSYPLFFSLRDVFAYQRPMWELQTTNQAYSQNLNVNLLGTFIDNHDQARFLSQQKDLTLYENAIAYTLLSAGIPIIYYGTEQGFNGGNDPYNREPLWTTNFRNTTRLYKFISKVNDYRKKAKVWNYPQIQRYADADFYAFTRGNTFVATTNVGSNGIAEETITYHPYQNGQTLCNLFNPSDCVTVQNGKFRVTLDKGVCKLYFPK